LKKNLALIFIFTFFAMISAVPAPAQDNPSPSPAGPKLRIGVLNIEPKAGGSNKVGDTVREMIITALVNSGKYNVVERGELDAVLKEQDLGTSGRITTESAAKTGKLLGAQVLVAGAITEYTDISSVGGVLLGPILVGGKSAKLTIDLRLIDASTGQILAAQNAEGSSSAALIGGGGTVGTIPVGGVLATNEPMGKAARDAVGKSMDIILAKTADLKWSGRIVKREGKTVYLNAGGNNGIQSGETFTVFSKGEDLIDPETGLSLGAREKANGTITVTEIKEKYPLAAIKSEDEQIPVKAGDIVRP